MRDLKLYPFEVCPLPAEGGGGFWVSFPDFSECIADVKITTAKAAKSAKKKLKRSFALFVCFAVKFSSFSVPLRHVTCSVNNHRGGREGRKVTQRKTLRAPLRSSCAWR